MVKHEKDPKDVLSKALRLMDAYIESGLNKDGRHERPDTMDDFLNHVDDLGIRYNEPVLNRPTYSIIEISELNGVFKDLKKRRVASKK